MAKINNFIAEYTDSLHSLGCSTGNGLPTKALIRRFVTLFRSIDDTRVAGMVAYPLEEIILIASLAVLGNASTWTEMERFGKAKERWLKKFLKLKHGISSHDTFRWFFSLIDTPQLQETIVAFFSR
ncbi:transposase family protein [Lachnospiraceae bacterium OttesenSCG-928-D06]|nr:transposase family protein [Lachnospiraceae bacterium OttesenSCG-928-D06]MDL2302108.1 transposase family protein [Lachnospiraceae bacterium OttesenSCG-928-D06]